MACVPTATMSVAPASYASSIATSSLMPAATIVWNSQAELGQQLARRREAVVGFVRDQLRAAVQRGVGERVEVADDDVGLEPDLEQRVGAAVDRDQHRLVLADVRPQRLEVVLVVVTAHDDERVPALDLDLEVRQLERLEGELGFLLDVLERVLREAAQLDADVLPRFLHPRVDLVGFEHLPRRDLHAVAPQRAVAELDEIAVADLRP